MRISKIISYKLFILTIFLCFNVSSCSEKNKNLFFNLQQDSLKLEKAIPLPGVKGRIDHLALDTLKHRLFVAALGNNSVEVIDVKKGERVHSIKNIKEPQGILYLPENNILCVTSGGSGECIFYNAVSYEIISSVKLGSDADNVRYDEISKLIYAGYGNGGNGGIAIIDALKYSKINDIQLSGHPESFQLEKNGNRIFVNVPTSNDVEIIDIKENSVVNKWKLADAEHNFPMALDEKNKLVFIGCRKPPEMLVYDAGTGKELTRFEIGGDADDIFYEEAKKMLLVSCGEGILETIKQDSKESYRLIQELITSPGARTSLYVSQTATLYLAVTNRSTEAASVWVYRIR
jgi:DNA-binding beta-propeller fold protein YncE